MVCPTGYRESHWEFAGKFDAVISYEELADYFRERSRGSGDEFSRMRFRAELLDQAVLKSGRGYLPVPNEVIGGFNARYVALLREVAPDIHPGPSMLKEANPDESVSMIFDHKLSFADLPKEIRPKRFAHELGRGHTHRANYVSVVFGGWGAAVEAVKERFEQDALELGVTVSSPPPTKARPNPGLVLTCATEVIDNQADFAQQQPQIVAGIQRAAALRQWLLSNETLLHTWRRQVEEVALRS